MQYITITQFALKGKYLVHKNGTSYKEYDANDKIVDDYVPADYARIALASYGDYLLIIGSRDKGAPSVADCIFSRYEIERFFYNDNYSDLDNVRDAIIREAAKFLGMLPLYYGNSGNLNAEDKVSCLDQILNVILPVAKKTWTFYNDIRWYNQQPKTPEAQKSIKKTHYAPAPELLVEMDLEHEYVTKYPEDVIPVEEGEDTLAEKLDKPKYEHMQDPEYTPRKKATTKKLQLYYYPKHDRYYFLIGESIIALPEFDNMDDWITYLHLHETIRSEESIYTYFDEYYDKIYPTSGWLHGLKMDNGTIMWMLKEKIRPRMLKLYEDRETEKMFGLFFDLFNPKEKK